MRRRHHPPPAPGPGLTIHELAAATGLTERGIQYYVQMGVLPRPRPRGAATRYPVDARLRVLAAQRLQEQSGMGLPEAVRFLADKTEPELALLAGEDTPTPAPEPEAAPARGGPEVRRGAPSTPAVADPGPAAAFAMPGGALGRYRPAAARALCEHVPLCPGVELVVRADADPEALRVAREIEALYRVV